MVHQYKPNFPHRFNSDGSYGSICTLCRLTVATERTEAELCQHERNHKCNPCVSTPRMPLCVKPTILLSLCRRIEATASWVASSWNLSTDRLSGEMSLRENKMRADT